MTVREILGDEFALLQGQGKSDSEIISLAKDRLKNPIQKPQPPQPTQSKTKEIPEWLKGETDSGLVNFGQDVVRGSTKTFLNYANLYNKATGGDTARTTELLQKLDRITEQHKAENRTPERTAEVEHLQKQYQNADGFSGKFGAGVDTIVDTLANPKEWQVGEFVGENMDLVNLFPVGRGVIAGATIGGIINGTQAGGFAAARDDKSGLDVAVEGALGTTAGVVLGGATGGITKKTSVPDVGNNFDAAREWTGFGKERDSYDKANDALGVDKEKKYPRSAYYRNADKVGEDGMLTDPFNKAENPTDFNPKLFEAEIVESKTHETFAAIINDEEAGVIDVDIEIKQLGSEMQAAGATQNEIELAVAQNLAPSNEAIAITHILNDGEEITPRLNGLNMQQAIINSINNPLKTSEQFYESMIGYGATQEHAAAATTAYETKQIARYSTWAHDKLAANVDKIVDVEAIKVEAAEIVEQYRTSYKEELRLVDMPVGSEVRFFGEDAKVIAHNDDGTMNVSYEHPKKGEITSRAWLADIDAVIKRDEVAPETKDPTESIFAVDPVKVKSDAEIKADSSRLAKLRASQVDADGMKDFKQIERVHGKEYADLFMKEFKELKTSRAAATKENDDKAFAVRTNDAALKAVEENIKTFTYKNRSLGFEKAKTEDEYDTASQANIALANLQKGEKVKIGDEILEVISTGKSQIKLGTGKKGKIYKVGSEKYAQLIRDIEGMLLYEAHSKIPFKTNRFNSDIPEYTGWRVAVLRDPAAKLDENGLIAMSDEFATADLVVKRDDLLKDKQSISKVDAKDKKLVAGGTAVIDGANYVYYGQNEHTGNFIFYKVGDSNKVVQVPTFEKAQEAFAAWDKKRDGLVKSGLIEVDNSYKLSHEALPVEETKTATQQSALFGNEQQLFDVPSETKLKTPSWAKSLVSNTVKYEDIVRDITNAKNGETPTPLAKRAMLAQAKEELKAISKSERYTEVLDMTRENEGTQSPQRLEQAGAGRELDGYNGTDKNTYDNATYSKNYQYDFTLTKDRVKRIEEGKATLQDIQHLKADLDMMENNPTYAKPTEEQLKARYDELAAHPDRIYDAAEFDTLEQRFDPETYAEKQEMFGETTKEESKNDTSYTGDLARDSANAEDRNTTDETTDANGGGAARSSDEQPARVNGADELSKQSDNSAPDNPTSLFRESSNTKLPKPERTVAASASAAADKKPKRSGGDDGDGVQTKSGSETTTSTKPKQKPKQSGNEKVGASTSDIKDFGEKIGGARKDLFVGSEIDTSKFGDFTANELFKTVKKNKVFKAIDYREFADSFDADKLYATSPDLFDAIGITPSKAPLLIAHFVKVVKDSIQTPKNGWSADKFKSYIEGVEIVRKYLSEAKTIGDFKGMRSAMFGPDIVEGRYINSKAKNYAAYSSLGSKFNSALSFSTYDIRKSARAVKQGWMSEGESKSTSSKFDVGEDAITGEFFVKRKKATWKGNLVADGFKTDDDAINFINSYEKQEKFRIYKSGDEYEIGRRYADGRYAKLKSGMKSEAEARKYLVDNIDTLDKMKGDDIAKREIVDVMTYGSDHRNGVDATPEKFSETFGFRGVEFGNWNSQAERQLNLNRAYDSLSDLADLLGIPQRAISLNGELALAFGARGRGGKAAASAHYEPDRVVINLTKKAGAGSLAHEWAHALDNYFGKKANGKFLSEAYKSGDIRADLYAMYKEVVEVALRRDATDAEMKENFTKSVEGSTKRLESVFETIEKQLATVSSWKKNARAATAAELKKFAKMKDAFMNSDVVMEQSYAANKIKTAEADAINAFYKKIKGNSISDGDYNTLSRHGAQLRGARKDLAELEAGTIEPYKKNTNFLEEAKELDKSKKDPYWSTTREIFARIFEAYVGDRLREKDIHNSYLVSGENNPYAYPLGAERVAINNALHKMQEEMKFRDGKGEGVELYSEIIPNIRKVVSFFENWDEKVDFVYDGISNFARGVDKDGNLKAKVPSDYKIINWSKNVGEFLQENFILGGARSDKLINMLRDLNNHKSTIVQDAVNMRAGFDHLSKTDNQNLVRALGGDMDAVELNHNLRPIYDKFRKMIDDQSDALVAAGALDPKYARENYLKRYYFENLTESDFFSIFKGGTANSEKFKRKEMSLADRIAKGQIEDAGYVIAKTILEQRDQLLKAEFFQKLNDAYGVEKMQDGYVQVPDVEFGGGVKKFGALNGKYVPYEVYESIKASSKIKEELGNIEKAANYWVKSVQHIKVNMTIKNAGTHLYNVLSNGYIAYLDGHYTDLIRILSDKAYYDKLKAEASRHGLDTMLDDMEAQFFKEHNPNEGALMKLYKNAYMAEGSKLGDAMRKSYEFEDVAFKLAAFAKRREALQFKKFLESHPELKEKGVINDMYNAHKYRDEILAIELSEDEIAAAFKEVDSIYVNYGTSLPKGVAGLDRSGLMPFMHYSWKATPIFLKLMAKHPFKVAALHVAFAAFGASRILGEDDERDKVTPEWMNDGVNILGVDNFTEVSDGEYLNIGRSVPAMRFLNMSPVSVLLGNDGGILANVIGITTTGIDNKGYSVDGRTSDSAMQRLANRASALSESISPPLFPAIPMIVRQKRDSRGKEIEGETEVVALGGRYFQKAYDALGGKTDKRGNPLEVVDVAKQAVGLKLQKVDKLQYAQKSVNKARKLFVREFNMSKSSKNRAAAKRKYKDEIKKIKTQMPRKDVGKLKISTSVPNAGKGKMGRVFSKKQMIKL